MKNIKTLVRKLGTLKAICILALGLNISGCALHSKDFDCKYEKGVGCKSITEVNHMVDKGELQDKFESNTVANQNSQISPIVMSDAGMIERVQEEHLRVWIAPHQDTLGNFHEASLVHTVIKPGYWQLLEGVRCYPL